jgi:hypothetical protein
VEHLLAPQPCLRHATNQNNIPSSRVPGILDLELIIEGILETPGKSANTSVSFQSLWGVCELCFEAPGSTPHGPLLKHLPPRARGWMQHRDPPLQQLGEFISQTRNNLNIDDMFPARTDVRRLEGKPATSCDLPSPAPTRICELCREPTWIDRSKSRAPDGCPSLCFFEA